MKHSIPVILWLLGLFLTAQFLGIIILYKYIDTEKTISTGETTFKDLPIGERPPLEEETSYITIILALLLGTGIALLLIKLHWWWLWKAWFFIAATTALTVALGAFLSVWISVSIAVVLILWRMLRPNFLVQTGTELFLYGGLAVIFAPLFTILSVSILLVLIALYDMYAVWKSKHMVTLAVSQSKAKIFAGLLVPYSFQGILRSVVRKKSVRSKKMRLAMLGGGDIGFPLIFAGVVLKEYGLWQSLVIPFFAMVGLAWLLWYGDEKKFYPAMPFIGAGCFVGLGVVWGIMLLV